MIISEDLDAFKEIIMKLIQSIDPVLRDELIDSFTEDNRYLDFVVDSLRSLSHG